jgi:hypothetical protein
MRKKIHPAIMPVLLAWALLMAAQLGGPVVPGPVGASGGHVLGPSAALAASADLDIEVDVHRERDAWYRHPVWIAILVLGGLVLIVLIIMAARGGGSGRAPTP